MNFQSRLSTGAVEPTSTLLSSQKSSPNINKMWTNSEACLLVTQPRFSSKLSKKKSRMKHLRQKMIRRRRLMTLLSQSPVLKSNHLHKTSWSLIDSSIQSELLRLTARPSQSVPTRWHLLTRWDMTMSSKDSLSKTQTVLHSINISETPWPLVSRRWWVRPNTNNNH